MNKGISIECVNYENEDAVLKEYLSLPLVSRGPFREIDDEFFDKLCELLVKYKRANIVTKWNSLSGFHYTRD